MPTKPSSQRTGARRRSEIPDSILRQLNCGEIETANLVEGLAIRFDLLLQSVCPDAPDDVLQAISSDDLGITRRMAFVGQWLAENLPAREFDRLRQHPSDTVRGWAAYQLPHLNNRSVATLLKKVRPLADDRHFGVREWAWLAIRPQLANNLDESLNQFEPWVVNSSENIRRFAVESLRPCGVWCSHITALKESLEQAMPLLEPVRADPSKYVQDSVSNWLSDAAKSQASWVETLLNRWDRESKSPATERITRRVRQRMAKRK